MKRCGVISALGAASVFGALAMVCQTLLLRRFLWRFEAAEAGVALFLASWLFWSGLGAAAAATRAGRGVTGIVARAVWLPLLVCGGLYFAQYALLENLRVWLGVPEYLQFPLLRLAGGCLLVNAPFCFAAGFVIPAVCRRLSDEGEPVSRAFAWEALGAAAGGAALTLLLVRGVAPDPRDEAEWFRYFPQAQARPGRFETGGGTTFYGTQGGTFYALSSRGVSETLPAGERDRDVAALLLSQRPYAKDVALLGEVSLATALALEALRPDLSIVWCPCDAQYGVRVLEAVRGGGVRTRVRAAGETPQRFLARAGGVFDAVLVVPPRATTLEGAAWRQESFAQRVRSVTRRTGVGVFGLECEAAALTPEKCALLEAGVRAVRRVWPESGVFAAGAGGWWVAAQVPKLAYAPADAAPRFALLKNAAYPPEAVLRLYDAERAKRLALACPALDPEEAAALPRTAGLEEVLALGWADALRRVNPGLTPGVWLALLKAVDIPRLAGLFLVALWMLPVVAGTARHARLRMLAAWVGAGGALGLTASLAVLYRLQLGYGSLYLLAGAGSCLYLAGLFCGNRLAAGWAEALGSRQRLLHGGLLALTLAEAAVALGVVALAQRGLAEAELVLLCFAAGCAAGMAVPVAFACWGEAPATAAPVFVFADALGAAVAGLAFVLLVPFAGLIGAVACFAALACGMAVCAAACGRHARLTAGLALFVVLLAGSGRLRELHAATGAPPEARAAAAEEETGDERAAVTPRATGLPGVPRRLEMSRIRELMQKGQLATNTAVFWE